VIVLDASLALDLALVTPESAALAARVRPRSRELAAPELIDLEILQALRRQLHLKRLDRTRAREALDIFESFTIERFSHRTLSPRIWALRDSLTAYDAAYFALAEMLDAPLWTRDEKLRSAPGGRTRVEVV
jgi:predicted nucleic acid-binding protein